MERKRKAKERKKRQEKKTERKEGIYKWLKRKMKEEGRKEKLLHYK